MTTQSNMQAVSVAATVLNEVADIDALVDSVMRQTMVPAEFVVVDGGSTDGTWEHLQAAKAKYPRLVAIQDESCSLQHCPGPIARGRNVATAATSSDIVAFTDAGCTHGTDWLANLTAPILCGTSLYSLGGAWIDPTKSTIWDVASAPFFGIKLNPNAPTKSCTARAMAFRKTLWERLGGFPEKVFLGEDTLFDVAARRLTVPAFPTGSKATYQPRHTLRSAVDQMISYSITDGVLGGRSKRLWRNITRCIAMVLSLCAGPYTFIPLLTVGALEVYFAFRLDWKDLRKASPFAWPARLAYSLMVPWIVAPYQSLGSIRKRSRPNRQNSALPLTRR